MERLRNSAHRGRKAGLLVLAAAALLGQSSTLHADTKPSAPAGKEATKKESRPLPVGVIPAEAWRQAATAPLRPGEIDALLGQELKKAGVQPAPLISDEQFVRRVTLDVTGRLPLPADVSEFLADRDPNKRAKLIDRLLDSPEYANHWARYWREVITSRATDPRGRLFTRHFDQWLAEQLGKNASWADIARAMITAKGDLRADKPGENGAAFFLISHLGADAVTERAAETSRIFLGVQIQCAQCHDHPSDVWKRAQFHEFAAYFARLKERPLLDNKKFAGLTLVSLPFGEHRLSDTADPKSGTVTHPRFLDGHGPGPRLQDEQRRRSLADAITARDDPWFAAAYVNRIWGELLGQSFYQPVDDLGPQKEAVFPTVLPRLAGAFRGSNYDMKGLFRLVLNSQAYQRQIRPGEGTDDHLLFAAIYPTRLHSDALWQSLVGVLGQMGPRGPIPAPKQGAGLYGFRGGFEFLFKQEFSFDPSARPEEVEGSIPQALLMMNSPVLNQRIQAKGTNLLGRILTAYPKDDDAVRMVYQRTLARRPTDRELQRSLTYIRTLDNRAEAFEDILWSLLNSTEFQTKR